MKVVWTFVIITFAISAIMYMGGVSTNNLSAMGLILDIVNSPTDSSTLWTILFTGVGAVALVMVGTATANALTGGNASVGITLGYAAFATYAVSLVADFISIINKVGQNCVLNASGQCTDYVYWVIWLFGVLMAVGFVFALMDLIGGND